MNTTISTDNVRLGWQGARLAAASVVIGSIAFVLMDALPLVIDNLSGLDVASMIILAILASLFSLPFSLVGGYFLGWFLQKTQWYRQNPTKVVIIGALIASVPLVTIFVIGGVFQSCIGSHGKCEEDFLAYATQLILHDLSFSPLTRLGYLFIVRFIKALSIAAVCGGVTAWRLSRVAQPKPA